MDTAAALRDAVLRNSRRVGMVFMMQVLLWLNRIAVD
jgi:hypothetical protein